MPAATQPEIGIARRALWFGALTVALLVVAAAWIRVAKARADPAFDSGRVEGLLKSDPALEFYLVERVVESNGHFPADFPADPRIEWPDQVDVPSHFPLAQVFVVAWAHLVFGGDSLVVSALWVSAFAASLALVGVYLLALELTRRVGVALLAALLAAATAANYRTLGFVLVDEDFCLPFLVLHVALAARAWRVCTRTSIALAALALGCALATWHAAGFFASLEALVVLGWLFTNGRSPLRGPGAWLVPAILVAFALCVPFLRHAHAALSFPIATSIATWAAGDERISRGRVRLVALSALVALTGLAAWLAATSVGGHGEYGHVFALLRAKLEYLGLKPSDPGDLDPEVRIMWQGPFETLDMKWAIAQLGFVVPLSVAALVLAYVRRRELEPRVGGLAILFSVSLVAAILVSRTLVLPALLAPVLAAVLLARARVGTALLAAALLVQIARFSSWISDYENPWYQPPERQDAIARLVRAVREYVPPNEPIAADFVSSPAILAWTKHPIAFQPKWESRESRRRAIELVDAFHHSTPDEFRRLITGRYRMHWLVVDRYTLGVLGAWSAGLRAGESARAGTAAAALLSSDDAQLRAIPGYELVWRSPPTTRGTSAGSADYYRLFKLTTR